MRTVIIGGSAGGTLTALLLARAGADVLVLERDPLPLHPDVEAAARAGFRQGAPQLVHPHMVMARCRALLQRYLPDVWEDLLAVGVRPVPLRELLPATMVAFRDEPLDDQLAPVVTRRSTFDFVLRRSLAAEPGVQLWDGTCVRGLLTSGGPVPRVTGVCTDDAQIAADLVIDASGARSHVDRWLAAAGARPAPSQSAACGLAYYSRHYRLRSGAAAPVPGPRVLHALDRCSAGLWAGDASTFQLAVVPLARDPFAKELANSGAFERALRSWPQTSQWLDALEPVSSVQVMGAPHNRLRGLVDDQGPIITGLLAVGDAVCTTNPTLSRGLGLAAAGAVAIVEAVTAHPDDAVRQGLALGRYVEQHVLPHHREQVAVDSSRLAALQHVVLGGPRPPAPPVDPHCVSYAELRAAAETDPHALRAFWQLQGLLRLPEQIRSDPTVIAAVRRATTTAQQDQISQRHPAA